VSPPFQLDCELERHRPELLGYCRRMLGSPTEAEDAVQDTLVRAWRGLDRLERRTRLSAWLYRIATNVCLDMLSARARGPLPMELGPVPSPERPDEEAAAELPPAAGGDPAEAVAWRETVRLAVAAALRHLSRRERAALILCEVLRWQAHEAAALLGTSVAAVTSALQRARATLRAQSFSATEPAPALEPSERRLLTRYVAALERDDVAELAALVQEDATRPATTHGAEPMVATGW
jgi:RNA polymerase sigma-70 factor, ECF subfamily